MSDLRHPLTGAAKDQARAGSGDDGEAPDAVSVTVTCASKVVLIPSHAAV